MFNKILFISLMSSSLLLSAPARSVESDFKQADGTTFKAKSFGNQHLNWIETTDGEILKYNRESKNFEYAKIRDSSLKASGSRFQKSNSKRARSLAHINKLTKKEIYKLWAEKRKEARDREKGFR